MFRNDDFGKTVRDRSIRATDDMHLSVNCSLALSLFKIMDMTYILLILNPHSFEIICYKMFPSDLNYLQTYGISRLKCCIFHEHGTICINHTDTLCELPLPAMGWSAHGTWQSSVFHRKGGNKGCMYVQADAPHPQHVLLPFRFSSVCWDARKVS